LARANDDDEFINKALDAGDVFGRTLDRDFVAARVHGDSRERTFNDSQEFIARPKEGDGRQTRWHHDRGTDLSRSTHGLARRPFLALLSFYL